MTLENWTTYTETDPGGDITVAANQLTVSSMASNVDSSVWKDFTAAHFGNLDHDIDSRATNASPDDETLQIVWAIGNGTIPNYSDFVSCVYWWAQSGFYALYMESSSFDSTAALSLNTIYYLTIIRETSPGNSLRCEIYSDSGRTSLLDTITVTYVSTTCRYLGSAGAGYSALSAFSGDHYNLDLHEGGVVQSSPIFQNDGIFSRVFGGKVVH